LIGNTVLPPTVTDPILLPHTGTNVTFESIRQALADLQMAYRDRGYVTVALSLPPQQLTNGIVRIKVTEGRLVEINVLNNRYFSSNNIMRELPSLHTNMLLNALVFQQELDRANANRDRQIYPVLSPGPDSGTSILDLKVKDRLPLHVHADLNNYSTPGTPALRANFSLVDNNLWQLNHQIGLQYSFSPEAYKEGDYPFYDKPLIANYSAYYRMPLGGVNGPSQQNEAAPSDFGYNEATRRFKAPSASGASELLFYASRSSSDTGVQLQTSTLTPLPPEGGLQISDNVYGRTLNPNEDLGARFTTPIKPVLGLSSSLSAGLDYKNYRSTLIQSRTFQGIYYVPEIGNTGPPFIAFPSTAVSTERKIFTSVRYLPFAVNWDANETDATGNTTFSLGQTFNFSAIFDQKTNFQVVAASSKATGNYYVITPGLTREQRISGDYGVRLHADGQWANQPLISNEQFSMGGLAGPRGYRDGAQYGDTGWRVQIEPHSPYWNMGLAFDKAPIVTRIYAFLDYGQSYLLDPGPSRLGTVSMLGTGAGVDVSIGEHFDTRVNLGVPLLDIPGQEAGHLRVEFSIGMQW
jgi:hemolysin activation/secretion protein